MTRESDDYSGRPGRISIGASTQKVHEFFKMSVVFGHCCCYVYDMNNEHMNTSSGGDFPEEIWDVFLPDGEEEPRPEEGDLWFDTLELDD